MMCILLTMGCLLFVGCLVVVSSVPYVGDDCPLSLKLMFVLARVSMFVWCCLNGASCCLFCAAWCLV